MINEPPRRRLYFSLATLLFAVACFAAIFGGFRFGYDRGYAAGQEQRLRETTRPTIYNIGDILDRSRNGQPDFSTLIDHIVTTIGPESWVDVGGKGLIEGVGYEQLIVNQTADVHQAIDNLFQSIREGRYKIERSPAP